MVYGRLCEEVSRACGIPPALVGRSPTAAALREGIPANASHTDCAARTVHRCGIEHQVGCAP